MKLPRTPVPSHRGRTRAPRRGAAGWLRDLTAALVLAVAVGACQDSAPDAAGDEAPESAREQAAATEPADDRASGAPAPGERPEPAPERARAEAQRFDLAEMGYTAGAADAPIRVIEFSDFGCGYCRRFHVETYPTLHEEYVETGKVRWKYVPFVLGSFPNASEAAHAGECAIAQDRFPPLRRRLFRDQGEWRQADRPEETFVRFAREEGLDADRFRSCLEEERRADRVRRNVELGRRVGVRGTPTFIVQGYPLQGAQPVHVFRQIFERLLAAER